MGISIPGKDHRDTSVLFRHQLRDPMTGASALMSYRERDQTVRDTFERDPRVSRAAERKLLVDDLEREGLAAFRSGDPERIRRFLEKASIEGRKWGSDDEGVFTEVLSNISRDLAELGAKGERVPSLTLKSANGRIQSVDVTTPGLLWSSTARFDRSGWYSP